MICAYCAVGRRAGWDHSGLFGLREETAVKDCQGASALQPPPSWGGLGKPRVLG